MCVFSDEWEACIEVVQTFVVGHGKEDVKQNHGAGRQEEPRNSHR